MGGGDESSKKRLQAIAKQQRPLSLSLSFLPLFAQLTCSLRIFLSFPYFSLLSKVIRKTYFSFQIPIRSTNIVSSVYNNPKYITPPLISPAENSLMRNGNITVHSSYLNSPELFGRLLYRTPNKILDNDSME